MSKLVEEKEKVDIAVPELKIVNIILRFPDSLSSESNRKEFILSKNDIRQSGYLSVLLDDCIDKDTVFEIPSTLYSGLRYIDLCKLIDLWIGREELLTVDLTENHLYDFKKILHVCDALIINEDLKFVKLLKDYLKD